MLHVAELSDVDSGPEFEFDYDVPLTVTWNSYRRLLDRPAYAFLRTGPNLVEVKMHPDTGELVELIVVSGEYEYSGGPGRPDAPGSGSPCVPRIDLQRMGSNSKGDVDGVSIVIHDDGVSVIFGAAASQWVDGGQKVAFGLTDFGGLVGIFLHLDGPEREELLGSSMVRIGN
jgi:hypothetical protein